MEPDVPQVSTSTGVAGRVPFVSFDIALCTSPTRSSLESLRTSLHGSRGWMEVGR